MDPKKTDMGESARVVQFRGFILGNIDLWTRLEQYFAGVVGKTLVLLT